MDDPYLYPGTDVLRNKENIRKKDELEALERLHSADRLLTLPHNLPITASGYREIHRYIFQDVYDWAGVPRTCPLALRNQMFALAPLLKASLQSASRRSMPRTIYAASMPGSLLRVPQSTFAS
jgi:cell filamentation protein